MRRLLALLLFACSDPQIEIDAGTAEDAGFEDAATSEDAGSEDAVADAGEDASEVPLDPVAIDLDAPPPEKLSAFNFFRLRDGVIEYNEGVFRYELNTPLFSDYAEKDRAIYVPPGTKIRYRANDAFEFPVGSAIIKTFLFDRIVETRLLILHEDGWRPYPYLWSEDGSDAEYYVRGATIEIELTDPSGAPRTAQYLVPQRNECFQCHEEEGEDGEPITVIVGPKARHLNRDGQLERMAELGILEGLPADTSTIGRAFDFASLYQTGTTALDAATLAKAARDYLDINCAHCHNPRAVQGVTSQLFLNHDNTDLFRLGICKEPGSAGMGSGGRRYDIVPGDPEASILWYRTQSETVGELMPLIGRSLRDDLGVGLIYGWIAGLPADDCL
jgi:uncharacterized repeat protein (TIGR03806 family)